MPRPVQHACGNLAHINALGLRKTNCILASACIEIDDAALVARPDGQLFHVEIGNLQEPALRRSRNHGQRIRHRLRRQRRALESFQRDVEFGSVTGAHALADIQDRNIDFADNHMPSEINRVQSFAHRRRRSFFRRLLVAATNPAFGRYGRRHSRACDRIAER